MKNRIWPGMEGADLGGDAYAGDQTGAVLDFLRSVHGRTRRDDLGDYYYEDVSTISLHLLMATPLPSKEVLWCWYDYFDREHSETIYQSLPPQKDEVFLSILEKCGFPWDVRAVRRSGLVFLSSHRKVVYAEMERVLSARIERYRNMEEEEQREFLTPKGTWSDAHIRREVRRMRTQPLSTEEKGEVYRQMESDYLRATARHLMDEVMSDTFWKAAPPELETVFLRFQRLEGVLREESMRLGLYVSRDAYEREHWKEETRKRRGRRESFGGSHPAIAAAAEYFSVLGLSPGASLEEVRIAYRERVKSHHPDQGGDVGEFLRLQEAYEYILTEIF